MNILITGISSGIGKGLCTYYLKQGHSVWGMSRRGFGDTHPQLTDWQADLSDTDALPAALNGLDFPKAGFDLVVLNAGVLGRICDMVETTVDELRHTMTINLWANKVLLDHLLTNNHCKDLIIGISSGASVNGNRGWNGYALSKASLNMMMALYAKEQPELHFIALAPGLVDSAMQDNISAISETDDLPSIERIQSCRGTDTMPMPDTFAPIFDGILPKLKELESGTFIDIRKM